MPSLLKSFGTGIVASVFGSKGGIGAALTRALIDCPSVDHVFACSRVAPESGNGFTGLGFDLTDEGSIREAVQLMGHRRPLNMVFVATGVLNPAGAGPEKRWKDLSPEALGHMFAVNTAGPALIAKHTLDHLSRDRKSVFCALSARVGSIEDNRLGGWHAYRASKAALNMILRSCSIELSHKNPSALCVAVHPGTVDTPLSRPFQKGVPSDQLFSPTRAAEQILHVVDGLAPENSGGFFAWDGAQIAF